MIKKQRDKLKNLRTNNLQIATKAKAHLFIEYVKMNHYLLNFHLFSIFTSKIQNSKKRN